MLLRYATLSLLSFLIIAVGLSAQPVACYAEVNAVVASGNCLANITAEDLLVGDYGSASTSVSPAGPYYAGTYNLVVSVGAPYNNSCITTLTVEDISVPTISCANTSRTVADPETLDFGEIVNSVTDYDGGCISAFSYDLFDYGSFVIYNADVTNWSNAQSASCSGTITIIDGEPQVYCNTGGNTGYEHIARVAVSGSDCNIDRISGPDPGGYHYEPAFTAATLTRYRTYSIDLQAGYSGSAYLETWRVYLDLNRDGDFTDAGETLAAWTGYNGTTLNFTIPANINPGYSRLRVAMRYGNVPGSCGNMPWGEVEDYSVYLNTFFWIPWFLPEPTPAVQLKDMEYPTIATEAEVRSRNRQIQGDKLATSLVKPTLDIVAFPNPLSSGQKLNLKGNIPDGTLRVHDLTGRTIHQQKLLAGEGIQAIHWERQIPGGIYLIQLISPSGTMLWNDRIVVVE